MAATAYSTIYLDEFISGFEQRQSLLRGTVATEALIKGKEAVFLIAKASRSAVTRGSNGLIPASSDDLTQITTILKERHDLVQKTGFDIFAGQADQRRIMQETGMKVINREMDDEIIDALETGTVDVSGTILTKGVVNNALTVLFNNEVENDGQIYGVLSPAQWSHLTDIAEVTSGDFVNDKPLPSRPSMIRWMNVNWMMHPRLPGVGTASAKSFIYHRDAVGHAADVKGIQAKIGYDEEQDYSFARHTIYHGAKKLQNEGIIVLTLDDTTYSANS
jgi:hypothetical protein